jgi:hypothetical protein
MSATFPVIINVDFGGCSLSEHVMKEYNAIPGVTPIKSPYIFDRTDERLAFLVDTSPHGSSLVVKNIPVKYKNHYTIEEYDGSETITVNFAQYQVAMIKEILAGSGDDKLDRINAFLENSPEEKLEAEFNDMY